MKRMTGSILASSLHFGIHLKLEDMKLCFSSILIDINIDRNCRNYRKYRKLSA
jgi:hypothetical protein